jgi:hypothetical protein
LLVLLEDGDLRARRGFEQLAGGKRPLEKLLVSSKSQPHHGRGDLLLESLCGLFDR